MKKYYSVVAVAVSAVISTFVAAETAPTDANRGAIISETERCQGCHGETGISSVSVIPNLAGQQKDYIVKQLRDFKSGKRKNPIMSIMAADIDDEDVADIAA